MAHAPAPSILMSRNADPFAQLDDLLRSWGVTAQISRVSGKLSDRATYNLHRDACPTGRITALPLGPEFNIVSFQTQPIGVEPEDYLHRGEGKALLAALVTYAVTAGIYDKITTTTFASDGAGFFLSRGFHNRFTGSGSFETRSWDFAPVKPKWNRSEPSFTADEIAAARADFAQGGDQEAFRLATSPMGKDVLWMCGSCGFVDLHDDGQMERVTRQLGIAL